MQQGRHEERPFARVRVHHFEVVTSAVDDIGFRREVADARADFVALSEARKRAHADFLVGRVADAHLPECCRQRVHQFRG